MPLGKSSRSAALLLALLAWALSGCASFRKTEIKAPSEHSVVAGQLVVQSDFPLSPQHRLLEELVVLRGELMRKLDLAPSDEPIYIHLFENEDRYYQYVSRRFPVLPQRRAFFLETDTRLIVFAHWGDRVAEDLRHEVAHGYIHSVVPRVPLWLDEGLAECAEVPPGRHSVNLPHLTTLLSKQFKDGWIPNLQRLESMQTVDEMTQADYAEAWAWVHWLLEVDPARQQLLREHVDALREQRSIPPISAQLGTIYATPERELLEYLFELGKSRPLNLESSPSDSGARGAAIHR